MALTTKDFDTIVSDQAVTAQASVPDKALDFSIGATLRAIAESFASVGLWLQGMVLRLLAATRAATSEGDDLDSWMADFQLSRLAAVPARGVVTFSRFTATASALIPAGAQVKTNDGAWTYAVTAAGAGYDATLGGYLIPAGQASYTVPIEATDAGVGGNAAANTVTLLASSIPGVDRVTNSAAVIGGTEGETDAALRARFRQYLASLPRGTPAAVSFAISEVQPGLTRSLLERTLPDGTEKSAHFTVVVDDGSGAPPPDLLLRVNDAVEQYRALGVTYAVMAPDVFPINVNIIITTVNDGDKPTAVAAVAQAVAAYINALPLGSGLSYLRLGKVAFDASDLVETVDTLLVNGAEDDIPGLPRRAIRAATIAVG